MRKLLKKQKKRRAIIQNRDKMEQKEVLQIFCKDGHTITTALYTKTFNEKTGS